MPTGCLASQPYSRSGEIPTRGVRSLELRVGVARGLGTTLSPQHNDISWAAYTGIGRDPGVSEVKPHPALCPAHVTVVQVVIRISVNLLRGADSHLHAGKTYVTRIITTVITVAYNDNSSASLNFLYRPVPYYFTRYK